MGGGSYERDVYEAPSAGGGGGGAAPAAFSAEAQKALQQQELHPELDPRGRRLQCDAGTPIVLAIDVTGSMGDWARILYDKFPMFFGQLTLHGYCEDPVVSIAGVGDAAYDTAPLQISAFDRGVAIDGLISKLFIEGGGGSNSEESYDLACHYYASPSLVTLPPAGGRSKPFFFMTGDEFLYRSVNPVFVDQWIGDAGSQGLGDSSGDPWSLAGLFAALSARYEVFLLKKTHASATAEPEIRKQWEDLIGPSRVIVLDNPRAIVDVMLGLISMCTGERRLSDYLLDMNERGQTERRKVQVREALLPFATERAVVGELPAAGAEDSSTEQWAEQLAYLNGMGFYDDEANVRLLQRHGGNLEQVANALIGAA